VLKNAGVAADKEIPVPPPEQSELNYEELYPQTFSKTATYIRFSQTVEECIGCMYDLTEEDVAFLKTYNQKRPPNSRLSDDDFERVMEVFEDTAHYKTPFASVDQTIAPYDDMVQGLQELETSKFSAMPIAKELYEYWKSRRQDLSNQPLHPTLKFETHQENDDMDPFVCFRRREVRQTRKTRARDVQSADKLKRLRKDLEEGRQIVLATVQRELMKAEMLRTDRGIYQARSVLKKTKRRLGIKTDDEDLINVRVSFPVLHPRSSTRTLTFCSRKRREHRRCRQYNGRHHHRHFKLLCVRMVGLPRAISFSWLIGMLRGIMSCDPTLRRRYRATKSGTSTTLTSREDRCPQ
jgi:enhancer of polycomb-like protein